MRLVMERRSATDVVNGKIVIEIDGELANLLRRFVGAFEALASAGDDDPDDLDMEA